MGKFEMEKLKMNYKQHEVPGGVPVKMWTQGVPVEIEAQQQLENAARLPIVFKHIAAMPDVHYGIGATVGSVIPTFRAIIPAAVGVDIGCGMIACKTSLRAQDLPDNLGPLRAEIEKAVPHGMSLKQSRRHGANRDQGSWETPSKEADLAWGQLVDEFNVICEA
jgi:tRNA-splicing ligase RtcB